MFYITLFFAFLYFKIARVHKKEEIVSSAVMIQHVIVGSAILSLLIYGFMHVKLYWLIPLLFVFATIASLMVTAIQIGIFVSGKPLFGLSNIYRYMPVFGAVIFFLVSALWIVHF